MEDIVILFSLRLRELRENEGIAQKALSEIIGVAPSRISEWERGIKRPIYEDLVKLAKYFDVTTDYLLGVEGYK